MRKVRWQACFILLFVFLFAAGYAAADADSLVVIENGNVGIATVNPQTILDVNGATRIINPAGRSLMIERDNEDSWLSFLDPGDRIYSIGIDRSDDGKFKLNPGPAVGDMVSLTIDRFGKLGIGTENPTVELDVNGPARIVNPAGRSLMI